MNKKLIKTSQLIELLGNIVSGELLEILAKQSGFIQRK